MPGHANVIWRFEQNSLVCVYQRGSTTSLRWFPGKRVSSIAVPLAICPFFRFSHFLSTMNRHKIVHLAAAVLTVALLLPISGRVRAQTTTFSVLNKDYVGVWNDLRADFRSVSTINADGTWTEAGQRTGTWTVEKNQLVRRFDDHSNWEDRFNLPLHDGGIKGTSVGGGLVTLTRRSTSAPAAVQSALIGEWTFFNPTDGKRVTQTLAADGRFLENDQPTGYWQVSGAHLYVSFDSHHEWLDTYDLPADKGVLHGRNRQGNEFTLARAGAIVAAATPPSQPHATIGTDKVAAATPVPAARPAVAARRTTTGYFGTAGVPTVASDTGAPGVAIPTPALPVTGVAPATRTIPARSAPAPTPAPTMAPIVETTPDPITLTPAGKWHWHNGTDRTITEKGAILEDTKVVGQWHWTDQSKRELQIQWSGTHYHPPEKYSLGPLGHHLDGSDPATSRTFTEERAD